MRQRGGAAVVASATGCGAAACCACSRCRCQHVPRGGSACASAPRPPSDGASAGAFAGARAAAARGCGCNCRCAAARGVRLGRHLRGGDVAVAVLVKHLERLAQLLLRVRVLRRGVAGASSVGKGSHARLRCPTPRPARAFILRAMRFRNSGKSMVPFPSASTCAVRRVRSQCHATPIGRARDNATAQPRTRRGRWAAVSRPAVRCQVRGRASLIMSCSSASVGFWPNERITVPSSFVVTVPAPRQQATRSAARRRRRAKRRQRAPAARHCLPSTDA